MRAPYGGVTVHHVEAGYPSTRFTVAELARQVHEYSGHPRIRRRVLELFRGIPSLDIDAEIRAVWDHVLGNVRYMRDPVGVEHVTGPVELDQQIDEGIAAEDCESMALYAATLLAAAGIPSEFEIQGRRPDKPERFTHCTLEITNPRTGEKVHFDPVGAIEYPGSFSLGDTLHRDGHPRRRFDARTGDQNMEDFLLGDCRGGCYGQRYYGLHGALLGDVEAEVKKYLGVAKGVLPALGPYGALAAGVIQVGEIVYDVATGKPIGTAPPAPTTIAPPPALPMAAPMMAAAASAAPAMLEYHPGLDYSATSSSSSGLAPLAAGAGVLAMLFL